MVVLSVAMKVRETRRTAPDQSRRPFVWLSYFVQRPFIDQFRSSRPTTTGCGHLSNNTNAPKMPIFQVERTGTHRKISQIRPSNHPSPSSVAIKPQIIKKCPSSNQIKVHLS